jgi:hypothetical protein
VVIGLLVEKLVRRILADSNRFLVYLAIYLLSRSAMVFVPLFFTLSLSGFHRRHHPGGGRGPGGVGFHVPHPVGGPRGGLHVKFSPLSVPANTPFTLAFETPWKMPFNITIGQNRTFTGYLDENGVPCVDAPPMSPGRKKLIAGLDDGTTKFVGFLVVEKRTPWKMAAGLGSAIVLTLTGGIFLLFRNMNRRRRKASPDIKPRR